MAVSAAGRERGIYMQYFTGDFDGMKFTNNNPPGTDLALDFGDSFYAAIPWNNLPDDQKTFIGWMVPGQTQTSPWKGQMSIPRELGLTKTKEGLRLVQRPAFIIKNNLAKLSGNKVSTIEKLDLNNQEVELSNQQAVKSNSYWLEAELDVDQGTTSGFKIAQKKGGNNIVEETEIGYDAAKNQVYVDKTRSGEASVKQDKMKQTIDLIRNAGKVKLEILFDKSSLEIFVNNGEQVLSTYIYPSDEANIVSAFATGGKSVIENAKIWDLSKVKNEANAGN